MPKLSKDKEILLPLNKLLEANDKLADAIQGSRDAWPYVSQCWIDELSEPTKLLNGHRLKKSPSGYGRG